MADVPARSTVLQISVAELCFPEKVFEYQIFLGFFRKYLFNMFHPVSTFDTLWCMRDDEGDLNIPKTIQYGAFIWFLHY